jgi:hypothetical protein
MPRSFLHSAQESCATRPWAGTCATRLLMALCTRAAFHRRASCCRGSFSFGLLVSCPSSHCCRLSNPQPTAVSSPAGTSDAPVYEPNGSCTNQLEARFGEHARPTPTCLSSSEIFGVPGPLLARRSARGPRRLVNAARAAKAVHLLASPSAYLDEAVRGSRRSAAGVLSPFALFARRPSPPVFRALSRCSRRRVATGRRRCAVTRVETPGARRRRRPRHRPWPLCHGQSRRSRASRASS